MGNPREFQFALRGGAQFFQLNGQNMTGPSLGGQLTICNNSHWCGTGAVDLFISQNNPIYSETISIRGGGLYRLPLNRYLDFRSGVNVGLRGTNQRVVAPEFYTSISPIIGTQLSLDFIYPTASRRPTENSIRLSIAGIQVLANTEIGPHFSPLLGVEGYVNVLGLLALLGD